MSLTKLPCEILEHILLYLTADDIYSWNEATNIELSDSFWKKTCLRDEVVKKEEENEICDGAKWKEEYFSYLNWKRGNYNVRYFSCVNTPVKIHKTNIFIPDGDKLSVCNVEDCPRFLGDLPTKLVHTFGSYIVFINHNVVYIYKYNNDLYTHYKTITVENKSVNVYSTVVDSNPKYKHEITVAMNETFLAIYQHKFKLLTVLNLIYNNYTNFEIDCSFLFGLNIFCDSVYTLLLNCNKYILNQTKLTSKIVEKSINISTNAAGILVPMLKYNDKIIVSLFTFFVSSYNTLKIMNWEGKSLEVVHIDAKFAWFCLENNYVIYPSTQSEVTIWNYNKPKTISKIEVDVGFKTGNTAPSCVLILVYELYLDVYSYLDCCRLYKINFHEPTCAPLINKWYCILHGSQYNCASVYDFKNGKRKVISVE